MGKLTLEEAIVHAKEVSEKNYRGADFESIDSIDDDIKTNCIKFAEEHEQLAEWLEELKSYKDLEEHGIKNVKIVGGTTNRMELIQLFKQ